MGQKYNMKKKQFAKYLDLAKKSIKQDKYIHTKKIKDLEKAKINDKAKESEKPKNTEVRTPNSTPDI